jgi:hypothetical protein
VLVVGLDSHFWTAYCFADAHFSDSDLNKPTGTLFRDGDDPICRGKYLVEKPIWDPREYFLIALASQIDKVTEDWSNVVAQLMQQSKLLVCS